MRPDSPDFTYDELVRALLGANASAPDREDGLTTVELGEKTGWHEKRVIDRLRKLKKEGRLEVVRVPRESLSGVIYMCPAYRLKEEKST